MNIDERKREFRTRIRNIRNNLSLSEQLSAEKMILNNLSNIDEFTSDTIFIYISCKNEAGTSMIINEYLSRKKAVAVPKIINGIMQFYSIESISELKKGYFGIPEPVGNNIIYPDLSKKELMIMPGMVFDKKLHRIGYGGGFYDKYLSNYPCIKKIALAYDFQIVNEEIPTDKNDILPDMIITEKRIIT